MSKANDSSPSWRVHLLMALLVAATALGAIGCGKKASQTEEQKTQERMQLARADLPPIPPQEAAWAKAELEGIWASPAVGQSAALVSGGAPESFRRDLAVLTAWPHRLAGVGEPNQTLTFEIPEHMYMGAPATAAATSPANTTPASQPAGGKPDSKTIQTYKPGPGSLFAGHYVATRLRAVGIRTADQSFTVAVNRGSECSITVNGQTSADIFALRPNHLQGVSTPAGGITGQTVYAGLGKLEDYTDSPADKIVVLDFGAGGRWLHAFALGAKAVIFIGQDEPAKDAAHHMNFPANLPRFFVTAQTADKLALRRPQKVSLQAACRWEVSEARNIIAVIRGTKPRLDEKKSRDQAILLSAPLDSLSEVPALSPGARGAANCSALLAMAEYFAAHPPRRDVILAFLDGDANNHAGAAALFGALYRMKDGKYELAKKYDAPKTLSDRLDMLLEEQAWLKQVQSVLAMGNIFSPEAGKMPRGLDAVMSMRVEADALAGLLRDKLQLLRIEMLQLDNQISRLEDELADARGGKVRKKASATGQAATAPAEGPPAMTIEQMQARLAELKGQLAQAHEQVRQKEKEDLVWSNLQRAINQNAHPSVMRMKAHENVDRAEVQKKYELVLAQVAQVTQQRIDELAQLARTTRQSMQLSSAIGDERNVIVLDLVMNLSDDSPRWMLMHGDDSAAVHKQNDDISQYNSGITKAIRSIAARPEVRGRLTNFEPRPIEGLYNLRMFAPGAFAHSGATAGIFGVPNLAVMTPMDRRPRDGQPCDVAGRLGPDGKGVPVLKLENLLAAADQARLLTELLACDAEMSLESTIAPVAMYTEVIFKDGKHAGPSAQIQSSSGAMTDRAARGAFVIINNKSAGLFDAMRAETVPPGFEPFCATRVSTTGRFELPPLSHSYYIGSTPTATSIVVGATFDERGLINGITNQRTLQVAQPVKNTSMMLFLGSGQTAVGFGFDRKAMATQAMKASSTAPLADDRALVVESGSVLSVYARRDVTRIKLFNSAGMVALGNKPGTAASAILGEGRNLDPYAHWPMVDITCQNLHTLNGGRLDILRDHHILEQSLERQHLDARELAERAAKLPPGQVEQKTSTLAAAAAISRAVYNPLLSVINDLVTAVVLLLLLAMPFAYAMERLLIGSPHIYRQIGWFMAAFMVTFVVLYVVNPAFSIAATPIIIFLAFSIILLSGLVIIIMTLKLQHEVRRIQGLGGTVHSSDVSRLGTMTAAVSMGISTMRRRPIRTLLTAATVVLLTFTILTFASFSSSWGNRRTYTGPLTGSPRLMVRHPLWTRINEELYESLKGLLKEEAAVVPRYWVSQTASEVEAYRTAGKRSREILVSDKDGQKIVGLAGLVGLDRRDVQREADLADVLGLRSESAGAGVNGSDAKQSPDAALEGLKPQAALLDSNGVFLTDAVATDLKLAVGDPVYVDGFACVLAGIIDRRKITNYRMLEDSSMLPVDYEASGGGQALSYQTAESNSLQDMPELQSAQFINFGMDRVAIVPAELSRRMGGRLASIAIYPADIGGIDKLGDRVATITGLPTYVGSKGGVYRLFFTSLTEASGWKDLIIPVVLGGLIIFATMLGSVSDREKEIYAFSALGLAPPHVASLFFAEAGVYAVVGGMGGYLLGQVVARTLGFLSESMGILSVPTMNYSSTNAIATVLVVMCTVLISTIYPAIKASRSANPGIQRHWRIGKPAGDLYDIVFPFTVSAYDITGVVSFLKEHFDNYSDTALGTFTTAASRIFRQGNDLLGITAEVALAPFDLGVSQKFALLAKPSEIAGIEEIRILLYRLSGTRGDWQRSNRVFINELRRQLLIWRSLSPEIMEKYRQRTLQQWRELPVEDLAAERFGAIA